MSMLKNFLQREVVPALGCTEPGAVALAVARACEELPDRDEVSSVRVTVSTSIYKNGMAVGIPGTRGARGNAIAAALGALCGHSKNGLEVLKDSTAADVKKAEQWVREERATIYCDPDRMGVYVLASVFTPSHKAICLIEGSHSHISRLLLDGVDVIAPEESARQNAPADKTPPLPDSFGELLEMADEIDDDDVAFLLAGVRMNRAIASGGLTPAEECASCRECVDGSRFGRVLRDLMKGGDLANDVSSEIRYVCSAAADARMSGILMPVMSSAGSGNHGITAILPIAVAGERLGKTDAEIAHALAVSHLATSYVNKSLGRLSPVCGCTVAAGAGAAAGLASLMGGDAAQIENAMIFLMSNLAGMLCDGAKESCAIKVGTGAAEAFFSARWALSGEHFAVPQGVAGSSIEETIRNVALISKEGMKNSDRVMIQILDERHRPGKELF